MTGVLAGLEDADGHATSPTADAFVGTSAGSIVAARLAAGREPRRARARGRRRPPGAPRPRRRGAPCCASAVRVGWQARARRSRRWRSPPPAPAGAARALARAGAACRRAAIRSTDLAQARGAAGGARFDGRLRVCTVDRASGRRVVFGAPGAPKASVADAVQASCAIPGVFKPVRDRRARVRRRRRMEP